jgi:class 3 adenylate cyclase
LFGPQNDAEHMSTASFTLLFTDIAASTEHALRLGDARWDALLTDYRTAVRNELRQYGGKEVDSAGDGFFAIFPKTKDAVRCARSLSSRVDRLGLSSRTGLHSGCCQTGGEKVSGIAVHVAARVMACAQPGEVLVSEAVYQRMPRKHSGAVDAGAHSLKGLPGEWALYRLASAVNMRGASGSLS